MSWGRFHFWSAWVIIYLLVSNFQLSWYSFANFSASWIVMSSFIFNPWDSISRIPTVSHCANKRWTLILSSLITESTHASCSTHNMTVVFRFYELWSPALIVFTDTVCQALSAYVECSCVGLVPYYYYWTVAGIVLNCSLNLVLICVN